MRNDIAVGTKIELVKPMGPFTTVGEVCEIVEVGNLIAFTFGTNGCHKGFMCEDELDEYFVIVKEEKEDVLEDMGFSDLMNYLLLKVDDIKNKIDNLIVYVSDIDDTNWLYEEEKQYIINELYEIKGKLE